MKVVAINQRQVYQVLMEKRAVTYKGLIEHLREECEEAGGAKPWGEKQRPEISFSYITAVLRGDALAGKKILKALKAKKVVVWEIVEKCQKAPVRYEDEETLTE